MPQDSLSYDVRHSKPIQTAPEAAPYSMPAVPSGMLIAIRYFMVQLLPPPAPITPPIPPNPKQNDPTVVGQFEIRVYFMSLGTDRSLLADVRGWCAVHAAHLPVPTFSRDACYRALLWCGSGSSAITSSMPQNPAGIAHKGMMLSKVITPPTYLAVSLVLDSRSLCL